jgi:hypothetical protein
MWFTQLDRSENNMSDQQKKSKNKNDEIDKKKIFWPDFLFNLDLKLNFMRIISI